MHFLPYSIYGEMIESIGRLEVDAYCGELAFLYQMLENVCPVLKKVYSD